MNKFKSIRRNTVMAIGILIMGLGVSIFKFSLMGNDPSNASYMAIAAKIGLSYAVTAWILNGLLFVIEIIFGRKMIGPGTFVNWLGVGVVSTFFTNLINQIFTAPDTFLMKLVIMAIGVLVLSFACSLYQTADVGIAPYDALSIILNEKTKIPYFWCRITTDAVCALVTWLLGGIVGLGTLVCALGLGPFITMFDKLISRKIVNGRKEN